MSRTVLSSHLFLPKSQFGGDDDEDEDEDEDEDDDNDDDNDCLHLWMRKLRCRKVK